MIRAYHLKKRARTICLAAALSGIGLAPSVGAHAGTYGLAPQTRLRVTVVQWVPAKGEYQQWGSVGGEFTVSSAGTISLPLVGTMSVGNMDNAELATKIAEQLKQKTGLITAPNATVEILEYPPIYVVGSVTAPGEHKFRPGMTVLQALALSGGRFRAVAEGGDKGQISMLGELKDLQDEIIRTLARIARLQAESIGASEIHFPKELTSDPDEKVAAEVMAQETIIFGARRNELQRQLQSLGELKDLFTAEIGILEKKTEALDGRIKLVSDELAGIRSLVERGIATVSRRSELELAVSNLQSNRLDEITAAMRARQSLSEATRNALSLQDKHQTAVSVELQEAQAKLERLRIKEDVTKKILIISDAPSSGPHSNENSVEPSLSFTIVRQTDEKTEEFAASEQTLLMPKDVVKVTISDPSRRRSADASATGSLQ